MVGSCNFVVFENLSLPNNTKFHLKSCYCLYKIEACINRCLPNAHVHLLSGTLKGGVYLILQLS